MILDTSAMGESNLNTIESNKVLLESADMKAALHKVDFYTENILQEICNNIQSSSGIGSYVSSYVLYPGEPTPSIRLNLRKAFFKRFGTEKNNSMEFYTHINNAVKQCYINNIPNISGVIPNYPKLLINVPLMYEIYRIDENAVLVNF